MLTAATIMILRCFVVSRGIAKRAMEVSCLGRMCRSTSANGSPHRLPPFAQTERVYERLRPVHSSFADQKRLAAVGSPADTTNLGRSRGLLQLSSLDVRP